MAYSKPCGETLKGFEKSFMPSRDDQVTIEMVLHADDANDAFDFGDFLGVDMSGLDDLDEMKRRLIIHLESQEEGNFMEKIHNQLKEKSEVVAKKREKLIEFLKRCHKTMTSFKTLSASGEHSKEGIYTIGDLLATDGKPWSLEEEISRRIGEIRMGDCVFVVSGETNAGKTSFLNLVLDSNDALTVKAVSCTSVCTRIMYSDELRVEILHKDGQLEEVEIDQSKPFGAQIDKLLYESEINKREEISHVQEVRLYMPVPLLQGGLVLVDTPGIGENHAMNSVTEEFITDAKIDGYIYIIKSDHAGGVQEDLLGGLLKVKIQTEKQKRERGEVPLHNACTMFVCNHWDNVKSEQGVVYNNAVKRLKTYMPYIKEDKVIRFSAKRAKQELAINRNYITPDFRDILYGLQDMYSAAMDNRIMTIYKWMESILKRLTRHLKAIVQQIDRSDEDMEEKMDEAYWKLDNLQSKTERTLKDLNQMVTFAEEKVYKEFKACLESYQAKTRITLWSLNEVPKPDKESFTTWSEVKGELYEITSKRISNELALWEEENGIIKTVQDDIVKVIKDELNILQEELRMVDDDVHSDAGGMSSNGQRRKSLQMTRRVTLPFIVAPMVNEPNVSIAARYIHPLGNVLHSILSPGVNRMKEYKDKPCRLAREKSEKFLRYILNTPNGNDYLRTFISNLFEKPRELLEMTDRQVPAMINSNRKLLQHIMHCRRETKDTRVVYEQMMESLEELKSTLVEYGNGAILVHDFRASDITICDPRDGSGSKTLKVSDLIGNSSSEHNLKPKVLRTLWTALQNGMHHQKSGEEKIFLRMYVLLSGISQSHSEVAKLRLMRHTNVAEFRGIFYSDGPLPVYVYRNHLKPLNEYLKRPKWKDPETLSEVVPKILSEIVDGLEYLHGKYLVHMELNKYTVTVDTSGSVKLSGACLPRTARLPIDRESIEISYFVYLSPDVLNGETYVACDDVYSLGLLAFELILQQKPFHKQRCWSIDQFIQNVNPSKMLDLVQPISGLPEVTREFILRCVQKNADQRPKIQDISGIDLFTGKSSGPSELPRRRSCERELLYQR